MRRPKTSGSGIGSGELHMAPLIDCVFLLLTYFLFTISLATVEGLLTSKLAMGGEMEEKRFDLKLQEKETIVRLVHAGESVQYFIDDWPAADFAAVAEHLKSIPEQSLVVIDASASIPYEHVIRLYNQCLRLSLANVVFPLSSRSGTMGTAPRL